MNTQKPFVIISAERPERGEAINADLTAQLLSQLEARSLYPKTVIGKYNGRSEVAYLVVLPGNGRYGAALSLLVQLATRYGQDTVLYVDSNRQAALYAPVSGWMLRHVKELGPWREIRRCEAERYGAFTLSDDRYFAAGDPPPVYVYTGDSQG